MFQFLDLIRLPTDLRFATYGAWVRILEQRSSQFKKAWGFLGASVL
jgi:hypothetical protein